MQDDKSNFREKTLCAHNRYAGIVRLELFNISECVTDAFEIKGSICTQEPNQQRSLFENEKIWY
jgi:hypothetical protein